MTRVDKGENKFIRFAEDKSFVDPTDLNFCNCQCFRIRILISCIVRSSAGWGPLEREMIILRKTCSSDIRVERMMGPLEPLIFYLGPREHRCASARAPIATSVFLMFFL